MNQKTRTALYSAAICACIISAATAVILTINEHNKKPKQEVTVVEEPQEEEDQPRQDRPRRRQRRGGGGGGFRDGRRGDVTRLLPDSDDFGKVPTPEEFEEELIRGLEEYRALPPEERNRLNQQMHQTVLFVQSGLEMMRENIAEIPLDELDRIRDDFDRFSDAAEQTFFSGIVEQHLTVEEDATIGEFVRAMHDAKDEFQMILHNG